MSYVFIGAHPDDIELGCGGTIETVGGQHVTCIIMTDGVNPGRTNEEGVVQALDGLGELGVPEDNIIFYNAPGNKLAVDGDAVGFVMKLLNRKSVVFVHSEHDTWHQDHNAAFRIAMAACRKDVRNIYTYESIFSFADGEMIPNVYVPISIEKKCAALRCYTTEYEKFGKEYFIERVDALAKMRGFKINVPHAEAFDCKMQIIEGWNRCK